MGKRDIVRREGRNKMWEEVPQYIIAYQTSET